MEEKSLRAMAGDLKQYKKSMYEIQAATTEITME